MKHPHPHIIKIDNNLTYHREYIYIIYIHRFFHHHTLCQRIISLNQNYQSKHVLLVNKLE